MRRVVVFLGGSRNATTAFQLALAANETALREAGVLVPRVGRRVGSRSGVAHQRLIAIEAAGWDRLRDESAASETLLLAVPALSKMTGATTRRRHILSRLRELADEVCIVSVVTDQLSLINEVYLYLVATWRTSSRLPTFGVKQFGNEAYVHERALAPWLDEEAVRYVAVPAPAYDAGNPLRVVLDAVGVPPPGDLVDPPPPVRLGPIGVEANRLTATYLRAEHPKLRPDAEPVAAASRVGLVRAERFGWCGDAFWGWTPKAAQRAVERFAPSNQRFAARAWGGEWPIPYPVERECTAVDVLDLEAATIETVQRYVVAIARRLGRELESA